MKISIVTPIYNQAEFVERTAESILSQRGDFELEWIVWDDGSTDGTPGVLDRITDPRLRRFREKNRGQCYAINQGMRRATGEVAAWLNSDDLYTPGALQRVCEAFARKPEARWLIGRCDIIDVEGREIRPGVTRYKNRQLAKYSYRRLLRENFVSQPATFWRLGFWREVGELDEKLYYTMDYDTWLRMGRRSDPIVLQETLALFRLHPKSKTGAVKREQFDEQFRVASKYFDGDWVSRGIHRFNVEKIVWAYRGMKLLGW